MSRRNVASFVIAVVLLAALTPSTVGAASGSQASTYAGAHVSFDVQSNAVANYAVDGQPVMDSVAVQSQSKAEATGRVGVDVSLKEVTSVAGSQLSLSGKTKASATVETQGSASMTAHDDGHGILVVSSGSDSQYVVANLSSGASASAEGDGTVVVTSGDTKGAFLVVGDGSVTVNDQGDVSAKLGSNSKLVFRAYPSGRSDADKAEERMISKGTATGEVYVMQQDSGRVVDTVSYGEQTSVSAEQSAENTVQVTVDRATSKGTVVITSVSKEAVGSVQDLSVTVDGKAAAKASSYSDLSSAFGSDNCKYLVKQSASASADAKVLVAFNHFSTRHASISGDQRTSGDSSGSTTSNAGGGDTSTSSDGGSGSGGSGSSPGFGVLVALAGVAGALLLRTRR